MPGPSAWTCKSSSGSHGASGGSHEAISTSTPSRSISGRSWRMPSIGPPPTGSVDEMTRSSLMPPTCRASGPTRGEPTRAIPSVRELLSQRPGNRSSTGPPEPETQSSAASAPRQATGASGSEPWTILSMPGNATRSGNTRSPQRPVDQGDSQLEAMRHARPVRVSQELIPHVPLSLEHRDLGLRLARPPPGSGQSRKRHQPRSGQRCFSSAT